MITSVLLLLISCSSDASIDHVLILLDHLLMSCESMFCCCILEPSESVLLALILCILFIYFLKWKLHSIRVPHYLIQNSYTLLSSKLRILIRTNIVLTISPFLIMTKTYINDMNSQSEYQTAKDNYTAIAYAYIHSV